MNYPSISSFVPHCSVLLYFFSSIADKDLFFLILWVSSFGTVVMGNAFNEEKLNVFQLTVLKLRTTNNLILNRK